MRLAIAVAACVLGGCYAVYDPCDDLAFREFPSTAAAMDALLDEVGPAKVYAVGEYHPTAATRGRAASPLSRFTHDILDKLVPRSRHLVVETWIDDGCGGASAQVKREVQDATGRPAGQGVDIEARRMKSALARLQTHGLPMTCIEHGALLDGTGRVDFLRLLELVTEKLGVAARALVSDKAVIVYGGALHNDLYPRWPLEDLSYAKGLQRDLGGGVVEIDLVVPEVVAPLPMVRLEDWFPLLGRAAPENVILWERGPGSYVLILPAADLLVASVAKPVARD
jgi:hypothetical protein